MAQFLVQVSYTPEAWAAMVSNPQNRMEMVRPVVKELGGDVDSGWLSFGEHDAVVVITLPDNVSAAAFAIAAASGGSVKAIKTTPLLSIEEGIEAMRKAGSASYRPPTDR